MHEFNISYINIHGLKMMKYSKLIDYLNNLNIDVLLLNEIKIQYSLYSPNFNTDKISKNYNFYHSKNGKTGIIINNNIKYTILYEPQYDDYSKYDEIIYSIGLRIHVKQ